MKKHGRFRPGWHPLLIFPVCALLILAVSSAVTLVQVKGTSMVPTFHEGQVLLVNRLAFGIRWPIISGTPTFWNPLRAGDLVVVNKPDSSVAVVKRVLATPGEPLRVVDHRLVAPGGTVPLSEAQEYWISSCAEVPSASLFVVGDNLERSEDSRDWGFVAVDRVVGAPWR